MSYQFCCQDFVDHWFDGYIHAVDENSFEMSGFQRDIPPCPFCGSDIVVVVEDSLVDGS